ncbi:MAG: hypothetical protein LBU65_12415 [Planctomycetaceae bacterium]|jgi:hypothetical protein|nr:hypothetical protein [Planctomycetaceae bacterium]
MKTITNLLLLVVCVTTFTFADDKPVAKKPDYSKASFYIRAIVPEGKKSPRSLETAIVTFAGENGLTVDLVAAIHVGDKAYYEKLNDIFKQYDIVLYELVAEEGHPVDKESFTNRKEKNVLGSFQEGMAEMLGLEHQLHHVDYAAKNFVHADLSPEEFFKRFSERGDMMQMLMRAILLALQKNGGDSAKKEMYNQGRFLGAMLARDPSLPLKRTLASMMYDQMEDGSWVINGDGSSIITDRNAACLKVLKKTIKDGKKKIAIFYGGAHLSEFAKSLEKDFKLKYVESKWVVAWDLN